jgi:hypothetical protein
LEKLSAYLVEAGGFDYPMPIAITDNAYIPTNILIREADAQDTDASMGVFSYSMRPDL